MARKIVSTGRGGTGKSTFVALMSRYLKPPSLFVDLDPDLSLADMLGIDLTKEGKRTMVEALYDAVKERQHGGSPLTPVEDRFKGFIWGDCLYEGKRIRRHDPRDEGSRGMLLLPRSSIEKNHFRTLQKLCRMWSSILRRA